MAPIFLRILRPVSQGQGLVQAPEEGNCNSRGLDEVEIDDGEVAKYEGLLILPEQICAEFLNVSRLAEEQLAL